MPAGKSFAYRRAPRAGGDPASPGSLALEIGVEELPPHEVARTADDVAERLRHGLEETGLFTDEDPARRADRLGFLAAIGDRVAPVLDWREIA